MSHKHKAKIEKLFEHPVSGNIDARKLFSALEHYGIRVDHTKKNKVRLVFSEEQEFFLSVPHGDHLSKDDVVRLRHWLVELGLTPENIEAKTAV